MNGIVCLVITFTLYGTATSQVGAGSRLWKWCFVCSGRSPDRECESYPQYVANGRLNCTRQYCTTAVQYDVKLTSLSYDDNGQTGINRRLTPTDFDVISISRGCEDVRRGNKCTQDGNSFTCYSTCRHDYCNRDIRAPTWLDVDGITSGRAPSGGNRTLTTSNHGDIMNRPFSVGPTPYAIPSSYGPLTGREVSLDSRIRAPGVSRPGIPPSDRAGPRPRLPAGQSPPRPGPLGRFRPDFRYGFLPRRPNFPRDTRVGAFGGRIDDTMGFNRGLYRPVYRGPPGANQNDFMSYTGRDMIQRRPHNTNANPYQPRNNNNINFFMDNSVNREPSINSQLVNRPHTGSNILRVTQPIQPGGRMQQRDNMVLPKTRHTGGLLPLARPSFPTKIVSPNTMYVAGPAPTHNSRRSEEVGQGRGQGQGQGQGQFTGNNWRGTDQRPIGQRFRMNNQRQVNELSFRGNHTYSAPREQRVPIEKRYSSNRQRTSTDNPLTEPRQKAADNTADQIENPEPTKKRGRLLKQKKVRAEQNERGESLFSKELPKSAATAKSSSKSSRLYVTVTTVSMFVLTTTVFLLSDVTV